MISLFFSLHLTECLIDVLQQMAVMRETHSLFHYYSLEI